MSKKSNLCPRTGPLTLVPEMVSTLILPPMFTFWMDVDLDLGVL